MCGDFTLSVEQVLSTDEIKIIKLPVQFFLNDSVGCSPFLLWNVNWTVPGRFEILFGRPTFFHRRRLVGKEGKGAIIYC